MQIIPEHFLNIIQREKELHRAILDVDSKFEDIVKKQQPVFFPQYTDHGIEHFADTLRMALHLIDLDTNDKARGEQPVVDFLSPLNCMVLVSSILFHDLGMHIHFKGFKQLINGKFDDVKISFFNDLTWKEEWENYMIEAKRFSGRHRLNILGEEQAIITDIDFSKSTVDSDIQKNLIGEFIRRNHGRLAHEIALKGFPIDGDDILPFYSDLKTEYKDIIGLIARSHSMNIRDAMAYIEETFPADPHFPYDIEVPFLMSILRIADYFQFDSNRTNALIIKAKSLTSPFSLNEHRAHLATEYFKTDEKDPETLFVDLQPKDGLMFTKLIKLFDDIQYELDTSFAVHGEMYGRHKNYLRLRYRRIRTNLKNKKIVSRLPYVANVFKFEADTDLFKLLVGPLYGYDASYGVRELIQNAVDACMEREYKSIGEYKPLVEIKIYEANGEYIFSISDNGKGMNVGEIKNYFLKAGASFRNSIEWKIDYEIEENTPAIRRTGKFGIGVLASFLIGDVIEVTTKRFSENTGYNFTADLQNEFIEVRKERHCEIGTIIIIKISKEAYEIFQRNPKKLTQWYLLSHPTINYYINDELIERDDVIKIDVESGKQILEDSVSIFNENFESIVWKYHLGETKDKDSLPLYLAINGILIPKNYSYPTSNRYRYSHYGHKSESIYDELDNFPFVSVLDKHNLIDLELSRNAIRGHLPFVKNLIESCKLDFLFKLIFFNPPLSGDLLDLTGCKTTGSNNEFELKLGTLQFSEDEIFVTKNGYFFNNTFFNPVMKRLNYFKVFTQNFNLEQVLLIDDSICSLTQFYGSMGERNILRGDYRNYIAISSPDIYHNNYETKTIAKHIREGLQVIEESKDYIIFKNGNFKLTEVDKLKLLFDLNKADAVQLVDKSLAARDDLNKLLKKHIISPTLIPYDFEAKRNYAKTLSLELQEHIVQKRGITL